MIPRRIVLKGFLCYRDRQEVEFDGKSLWMLAGRNGSGKSAVFDGMTFALFGHHRGGGRDIAELINHDSSQMSVEFEFALDGRPYRIRRTSARNPRGGSPRSTQQILSLADDEQWQAIDGTHLRTGFDEWVADHIGLTYDTFTSSVLLLQGRSERLLDAKPAERFGVLAGIVDLERYSRLHEKADAKRRALRSTCEALQHQLDGLQEVSDVELAEIDGRMRESEDGIVRAQAETTTLNETVVLARRWEELSARSRDLDGRIRMAEKMLADAESIRADLARFRELNDVVPILTTAVEKKKDIQLAGERIDRAKAADKELVDRSAACEHALDLERTALDRLEKTRAQDETSHGEVQRKLVGMSGLMTRVQLCEAQRETLKRQQAELAQLPADLDARLVRLRAEVERLTDLERALPLLTRLIRQRNDLRLAQEKEAALGRQDVERKQQGEQLRRRSDELKQALSAAEKTSRQVESKATEEKTLFDQADAALREFQTLEGAKICRQCGQALTPAHFEMEIRTRKAELEQAHLRRRQADVEKKKAVEEEKRLRLEMTKCEEELTTARDDYRTWKRDLDEAHREVERLTRESSETLAALPEHHRNRDASELPTLQQQAAGAEKVRRDLREAETHFHQAQSLRERIEQTRTTLLPLETDLPEDVGALRRNHSVMVSQEASLRSRIDESRRAERAASEKIQKLDRDRAELHRKRTDNLGTMRTEESRRSLLQETVAALRQKLPATWQAELDRAALSEIHRFAGERDRLSRDDVEGKAKRLEEQRLVLESLNRNRADLQTETATIPVEARVPAADLQRRLAAARADLNALEVGLRGLQRDRAVLDSRRQQRADILKRHGETAGELSNHEHLAKLLGRDRLQRHLVRQAERQVIDHANVVLDRLSGGQLHLRLRAGDDGDGGTDKALDLEAFNRSTAQTPINVAFLSGSQRFRVAVSLALGLGQFASRRHRPIESVIIDEGFGCLDRQGRQVMIQELQNLRGHMSCILLVSHQEEFTEAFADGYVFELNDGATTVKRFSR